MILTSPQAINATFHVQVDVKQQPSSGPRGVGVCGFLSIYNLKRFFQSVEEIFQARVTKTTNLPLFTNDKKLKLKEKLQADISFDFMEQLRGSGMRHLLSTMSSGSVGLSNEDIETLLAKVYDDLKCESLSLALSMF